MPEMMPHDPDRPLLGVDLRHAALLVLDRWGEGSIGQILEALAARGFTVHGTDPRKVLADALRHEVRRGRARRVGWGRYAIRHLAQTTRWRIGMRWDAARRSDVNVHGTPIAPGEPLRRHRGAVPWTVHDRDAGQFWWTLSRNRYQIGQLVLRVMQALDRPKRELRGAACRAVRRATVDPSEPSRSVRDWEPGGDDEWSLLFC